MSIPASKSKTQLAYASINQFYLFQDPQKPLTNPKLRQIIKLNKMT